MGTRIGFVEKGSEKECGGVGLGLRMQKTTKTNYSNNNNNKLFSGKKIMMDHHHDGGNNNNNNNNDPTTLQVTTNNAGFCEEQQQHFGGPLFSNTNSLSDMYDVGSFLFPNSDTLMSYNSSGVMLSNGSVRHNNIPFTASQRQELETQTMIYKYMMASVPVPPQLLIPITNTTANFTTRSLELGISSNSSDSEPWRCRRTDGKKWRCSRNVVPDQKYCERHSHKSRPRSRKHVEQNSQLNTKNNHNNNTNIPYAKASNLLEQQREKQPNPAFSATSHDQPRSLDWFMKGHEEVGNQNQDWHQMVQQTKPQQQQQQGFSEINHQVLQQQQQQQSLFLDDSNLRAHSQTRHFIDAWSEGEREHLAELGSHNGKTVTLSSLTLSMNGGNRSNSGHEDSEENTHMGFGIGNDLMRSQWLMNNNNNYNNAISWNDNNGSPPGGPLAEALCLGMAGSSTRESSSRSS